MKARPSAIIVVCLAATAGCDPGPSPDAVAPSVVFITIDTLRADHLHTYGYFRETSPRIDAFAEDALLFERAVATMPTTLPSHVSIFTSTYPARHGILDNFRFFRRPIDQVSGLRTFAQMLHEAGYETAAFTGASPLCAASGINAGFETFRGVQAWDVQRRRYEVRGETSVVAAM